MDEERGAAISPRFSRLAKKMHNKRYRDGYVASHTRQMLARQMRKFRGGLSQTEFAAILDKQQTIVSRLENPSYSGWTLKTLFEIAQKRNVAVFVRFVDFLTFLKYSSDMSDDAMRPKRYDQQEEVIDQLSRWMDITAVLASKSQPGFGAITLRQGGTGVNEAVIASSRQYDFGSYPN